MSGARKLSADEAFVLARRTGRFKHVRFCTLKNGEPGMTISENPPQKPQLIRTESIVHPKFIGNPTRKKGLVLGDFMRAIAAAEKETPGAQVSIQTLALEPEWAKAGKAHLETMTKAAEARWNPWRDYGGEG